ncbi:MAG: pentapeptide repeat-containing protein [Opitutae bacterium]
MTYDELVTASQSHALWIATEGKDVVEGERLVWASPAAAVDSTVAFESLEFLIAVLDGAVFDNCEFVNCNFQGASFVGCSLVDTVFTDCSLAEVDFNGADVTGTSFNNCEMIRSKNMEVTESTSFYLSAESAQFIISHKYIG